MRQPPAKVILVGIVTLFILPLAMAWILYASSFRTPVNGTANLGQLVLPMVPLDWTGVSTMALDHANQSLEGFWVIVYHLPKRCEQHCLKHVTQLRQLHRASGRNRDRIKIILFSELVPGAELSHDLLGIYPAFNLASKPSTGFTNSLRQAGRNSALHDTTAVFYLVDPLGNIMMTYSGDDGPGNMSKDLKTLLTWSKLDKRT
jgi:hypothetical protein